LLSAKDLNSHEKYIETADTWLISPLYCINVKILLIDTVCAISPVQKKRLALSGDSRERVSKVKQLTATDTGAENTSGYNGNLTWPTNLPQSLPSTFPFIPGTQSKMYHFVTSSDKGRDVWSYEDKHGISPNYWGRCRTPGRGSSQMLTICSLPESCCQDMCTQ
jgi:hypothetical protein